MTQERKIIQISTCGGDENIGIFALCNDGSLFRFIGQINEWFELLPIPQPEQNHD